MLLHRLAAAVLVVLGIPALFQIGAIGEAQPVREGEPAPQTVFAEEQLRIVDEAATETARRIASESVDPILVIDRGAQSAIVRDVREVFLATRSVREPRAEPGSDPPVTRPPTVQQQRAELATQRPELGEELVGELVRLTDGQLDVVERESIAIAQDLARQRVDEQQLEQLLDETLPLEVELRSFPGEAGSTIVLPLIAQKMLPTVTVDPDATAAARARSAEAVDEVVYLWRAGEAIVREGEIVGPQQALAVEQLGLDDRWAGDYALRAVLAMALVTGVGGIYLMRMQPRVWASGRKLVLLGLLTTAYAAFVVGSSVLVEATSGGWAYAVPASAFAMLTALLIHPVVGIATMLPAAIVAVFVLPVAPSVGLFAAAAVLVSVPLTTRIGTRSELRTATLRAGLALPVIAVAVVAVFGPRDQLLVAAAAGAVNGVLTAMAVQGAMPFLESWFRLPTVTALLDLADRNHPLLRQLETEAIGTYNHSVMVASLTERACRAIGADPLLGSVAALYHDIGKVRRPQFFIENQQGIANPHDDLDPATSAVIIQSHVPDGRELALKHRLPQEVVDAIVSHHGTMLVSYFYEQAVRTAGGDRSGVDECHFRHQGGKPRSKEAALVMLADCCEATTRAMAMSRGTLPRDEIEATVDRLLAERVDDGQFDESDLTFRELATVRDTIVDSLVGIYHPRIAYPASSRSA